MRRFIRFVALACIAVSTVARAQQSWTLDNGVVHKTISFTPDYGLEITDWTDLTSHHNFVASESLHHGYNEFQFTADGKNVSGKSSDVTFSASHAGRTDDATQHLDLTFVSKRVPITVTVHYELGDHQPAVRQSLSIVNTGAAPIILHHLTVSAAALAPGSERDLVAYGGYGEQPRETYFTGRVN